MSGYGPGDAWAIVRDGAFAVLDRGLDAERARALHEALAAIADIEAALAVVGSEPLVLVVGVRDGEGWSLARTRAVPAETAAGPLPAAPVDGWTRDEGVGVVRVGDVTVHEVLPIVDGVVRARVVAWGAIADVAVSVSVPAEAVLAEAEPAEAVLAEPAAPETAVPAEDVGAEAAPAETAAPGPAAPAPVAPPGAPATPTAPVVAQPPMPAAAPPVPLLPPAPASAAPAAPHEGLGARGLIDSVPGFIRPATPVAQDVQPQAVASAPALAPAHAPSPAVSPEPLGDLGDHDGMTIAAGDARALAAMAAARSTQAPAQPTTPGVEAEPATGPLVLSTLCPSGHVQPAGAEVCARCGAPVGAETAARRARPEFAMLALASGERIPLGRGVVLGRRPRSGRVEDGRVPRLVAVESPNEDISRSHLEVRLDDWTLVATDLDSTNGTVLLRQGADPVRLRPSVATIVAIGDRLDLGDGVVVTIELAS